MNKRKIMAVVGALVLAAAGTVALVAYVNEAEDRAVAGEERVAVLAVKSDIAAGTPVDQMTDMVRVEMVPAKVRPANSVDDLDQLAGLVAEVELVSGEQLLESRFVDPLTFQRDSGRVTEIPPGLQEITLSLEPERAGGATLLPGDTVGVFASFEPFSVSSEVPIAVDDGIVIPPNGETPNTTGVILHKVLVTNVQLEELPDVAERAGLGDEDAKDVRLAPTGNLLVTLAVDTDAAERLVFTAEFGLIWLSNEPSSALEGPSSIQTRGTIYQRLFEILAINGGEGS